MKKKKKRSNTPRVKRMNGSARLQSAKHWIPTYTGKDIIRGYRKHYGVNTGNAISELRLLGVPLTAQAVSKALQGERDRQRQKQLHKIKREERIREQARKAGELQYMESDETYAYIAGYTSGGAPFGITWEEWEELEEEELNLDSLYATIPPK